MAENKGKIWNLKDYKKWETDKWIGFPSLEDNIRIMTTHHLLTILAGDTILESFNLMCEAINMQGFIKTNIMLVLIKKEDTIRKMKLEFSAAGHLTSEENCQNCFIHLRNFFHMQCYDSVNLSAQDISLSYKNWLSTCQTLKLPSTTNIKLDRPTIEERLKMCLMDPMFPELVNQCEELIKNKAL